MPRMLRVEYPGAVYHVMCRGNDGQAIYLDDGDREMFLATLTESCRQTGWKVHAYVLMGNHYHLLVETPEANLVAGMKWLQGTYTQRFNSRHRKRGHLFQGRYKALLIDHDEPEYFRIVANYIHLNPIRAHLIDPAREELSRYPWSSFPYYMKSPSRRPGWLETSRVLSSTMQESDGVRGRARYRRYMKHRAAEELDGKERKDRLEEKKMIRRGWLMGSVGFRDKILDMLESSGRSGTDNCRGDQRREHGEKRAEVLIGRALGLLGLSESEIVESKSTRPEKQAIAWLVKKNTTVTCVWLANRLGLGHRVNASRAVSFVERDKSSKITSLKRKMLQCTG